MMRILAFPPPAHFNDQVRTPGVRFLARTPHPRPKEWQKHNYWRHVHSDLVRLYRGICAYCASWMPTDTPNAQMRSSIDHFVPRSASPKDAYEWHNFRICRRRMNQNKGEETILDPIKIVNGWFQLDFDTFLIGANQSLNRHEQARIVNTIDRLDVNHGDYVGERSDVVRGYCLDEEGFDIDTVRRLFPFIALEMKRVSFDRNRKAKMRQRFERLIARGVRFS